MKYLVVVLLAVTSCNVCQGRALQTPFVDETIALCGGEVQSDRGYRYKYFQA